jgi:hypothetical protein
MIKDNSFLYNPESDLNKDKVLIDPEEIDRFKKGKVICIEKISVEDGSSSRIQTGRKLFGTLLTDIKLGHGIWLEDGNTSKLTEVYKENDGVYFKTSTSTYKLVTPLPELEYENLEDTK